MLSLVPASTATPSKRCFARKKIEYIVLHKNKGWEPGEDTTSLPLHPMKEKPEG
jgi:hypothetical protein